MAQAIEVPKNIEVAQINHALGSNAARPIEFLPELKALRTLVPMCASCKSIRDEAGDWVKIEEYVRDAGHGTVSHGLCQQCAHELYPELRPT